MLITICFTVRIVAHAEVLMKNCLIFIKKIPDGIKSAVTERSDPGCLTRKMIWGNIRWNPKCPETFTSCIRRLPQGVLGSWIGW